MPFDVTVVGLGALGSFALRALALRGRRVLGLDRFHPPHSHGSSHGRSRIIRAAYFEHPLYVPLVRRAWEGWRALEAEAGEALFRRTGVLMIGPEEGEVIRGTLASARAHGIEHRRLSGRELRDEYPLFDLPPHEVGVLEEGAGVLTVEASLRAALASAEQAGAELRTGVDVGGWAPDGNGFRLETPHGPVHTHALVLAAGPWMPDLLDGEVGAALRVERQVACWFEAPQAAPDALPVTLHEYAPGRYLYFLPDLGDGLKAALHHEGPIVHPDEVDRTANPDDEGRVRAPLERLLPGVVGPVRDASVCLYTNTPDGHFLLGRHPDHPGVVLLGGGSGHAFKFAPVLAEHVCGLLESDAEAASAPFSPARLHLL